MGKTGQTYLTLENTFIKYLWHNQQVSVCICFNARLLRSSFYSRNHHQKFHFYYGIETTSAIIVSWINMGVYSIERYCHSINGHLASIWRTLKSDWYFRYKQGPINHTYQIYSFFICRSIYLKVVSDISGRVFSPAWFLCPDVLYDEDVITNKENVCVSCPATTNTKRCAWDSEKSTDRW